MDGWREGGTHERGLEGERVRVSIKAKGKHSTTDFSNRDKSFITM